MAATASGCHGNWPEYWGRDCARRLDAPTGIDESMGREGFYSSCVAPLRTAQSAGWPPEGDRTSSVDSVESPGYRCGQDKSRVVGAIVGRPDRSDTMQ